jgi:hypothetical protein
LGKSFLKQHLKNGLANKTTTCPPRSSTNFRGA